MLQLSVLDMIILCQQALNTIDVFVDEEVSPEEIVLQLNRAQYKIIDGILDPSISRELLEGGIDIDQTNIDALQTIYVKNEQLEEVESLTDYKIYELPSNYYSKVLITSLVNITDCDITKKVKVRTPKLQEFQTLLNHPFGKSQEDSLLGTITDNKIHVYTFEGGTIKNVYLDYCKTPQQIEYVRDVNGDYDSEASQDCILGSSAQYLVVDLAIAYLTKISNQPQQKVVNMNTEK